MDNVSSVKIMQFNCEIKEYPFAEGSTVSDIFEMDGRPFVEGRVTRRNVRVSQNDRVYNGDTLFITDTVKGNADPFEVEFHRLSGGGRSVKVPAMGGYTVQQCLDQLDTETKAGFFRADGKPAYEFRVVENGVTKIGSLEYAFGSTQTNGSARVLCTQVMKGNGPIAFVWHKVKTTFLIMTRS